MEQHLISLMILKVMIVRLYYLCCIQLIVGFSIQLIPLISLRILKVLNVRLYYLSIQLMVGIELVVSIQLIHLTDVLYYLCIQLMIGDVLVVSIQFIHLTDWLYYLSIQLMIGDELVVRIQLIHLIYRRILSSLMILRLMIVNIITSLLVITQDRP